MSILNLWTAGRETPLSLIHVAGSIFVLRFYLFIFLNSPDFFFHRKIQSINVKEKNSKVSQLEDSETIC